MKIAHARHRPSALRFAEATYRDATVSEADRWDAMVITNGAFKLMRDWTDGPIAREYSLSADWDDRWRTGGTVDEVMDETACRHSTTWRISRVLWMCATTVALGSRGWWRQSKSARSQDDCG